MTAMLFRLRRATEKSLCRLAFIICCFVIANEVGAGGFAQVRQQDQSREINSEDYSKNRPAAAAGPASNAAPAQSKRTGNAGAQTGGGQPGKSGRKHRLYHLADTSSDAAPAKKKKNGPANSSAASQTVSSPKKSGGTAAGTSIAGTIQAQVGVTLWRLRPPTAADADAPKIQVRTNNGVFEKWTAERAASNARFAIGERVWLSIESPQSGYLYVIDREQYADGKTGEAMLIFPTSRTRSNSVSAGVLVDLPGQDATPPYFTLKSRASSYLGEALTVIVTPQPLDGLTIGRDPLPISAAQLQRWETEWGTEAEIFEMDEGAGTTWTNAEQLAGGTQGRALTQEEPTPQTIYRLNVKPGSPLLINLALRVRATQ